jgi:hypothetical protein
VAVDERAAVVVHVVELESEVLAEENVVHGEVYFAVSIKLWDLSGSNTRG